MSEEREQIEAKKSRCRDHANPSKNKTRSGISANYLAEIADLPLSSDFL